MARRGLLVGLGIVAVIGLGAAAWLLKPVIGPARDLSLAADIGHGDYLIRLAGCVACHTDTANGGAFLAGGAPIATAFGSFVPPNITSDPIAGIGGWTLAQFSRAMSEGIGPDGQHYYPAFPYDNYTLMSDADIVDLFAALQTVPPVSEPAQPHRIGFPFNIRLAMAGWKNLFFIPARFEGDTLRSELWNRGAYIVQGPGHCGACHTPRNVFGAREGVALSGGAAPALTAEALVAKGYDQLWLEEVLLGGVTPEFDIPGREMAEVISESTTHWTQADIAAVAAYLLDSDVEAE